MNTAMLDPVFGWRCRILLRYQEHMNSMNRFILIAAAVAFLNAGLLPADAAENYESGETLLPLCEKPQDSSLYGFCAGYIIGAADMLDEGAFCPPDGHDKLQIVDATVQWLGNHSGNQQEPAHSLIAKALAEIFPCS